MTKNGDQLKEAIVASHDAKAGVREVRRQNAGETKVYAGNGTFQSREEIGEGYLHLLHLLTRRERSNAHLDQPPDATRQSEWLFRLLHSRPPKRRESIGASPVLVKPKEDVRVSAHPGYEPSRPGETARSVLSG